MREAAGRQSVKGECREWGAARGKKPQCCRREGDAALGHARRASEAPASGRRGTGTTDCGGVFSVLAQAREDNSGGRRAVIGVLVWQVCSCVVCVVLWGTTRQHRLAPARAGPSRSSRGLCPAGDVRLGHRRVLLGCQVSESLVVCLAEALTLSSLVHQEEGHWRP